MSTTTKDDADRAVTRSRRCSSEGSALDPKDAIRPIAPMAENGAGAVRRAGDGSPT